MLRSRIVEPILKLIFLFVTSSLLKKKELWWGWIIIQCHFSSQIKHLNSYLHLYFSFVNQISSSIITEHYWHHKKAIHSQYSFDCGKTTKKNARYYSQDFWKTHWIKQLMIMLKKRLKNMWKFYRLLELFCKLCFISQTIKIVTFV